MVPERNATSNAAKSVFFEEYNDIDIYIEDTENGYEKLFTEIYSRLLKGIYRVSKVFPLGSRLSVIQECKRWQGNFARPSLYIIDGDLQFISSDEQLGLDGLFVLPAYCIENMLIEKNSILELANEEDTVRLKPQLESEFDFDGWAASNSGLLLDLFTEYGTCFSLCPDLPTVSFPISKLVSSPAGIVDEQKIHRRIKDLRSQIVTRVGDAKYLEKRAEIAERIRARNSDFTKIVSGKDYLLPLIISRIKSIVKTRISNINFKMRLAMKCDLDLLKNSSSYIAGTAKTT